VYCGQHLRTGTGAVEPALIDPDLPVEPDAAPDAMRPEIAGLGRRPGYHLLTPAGRGGYLRWLAGGRRGTPAPVGFAWLFLFGLERRMLIDADHDRSVRRDLPAIAAELRRLRATYADDQAFSVTANALLDVVELTGAARPRPGGVVAFPAPPPPGSDRTRVPMALRIALARSAATATPVPADWARSWLWYHPTIPTRAAQRRCPREFDKVFAARYAQRHGAGYVPGATGNPIRITYQPASPGIPATVIERPDLPDVLTGPAATAAIGGLLDEVAAALTPYSRWLAGHPEGQGSLAATALLPDELVDPAAGPLGHLVAWATARLDGHPRAVVDAAEFGVFWSSADPVRMSGTEAEGLAAVLARVGLGVEPDVRFGGQGLGPGPVVLFRLPGPIGTPAWDRPTPAFRAAAPAVDLAAGLVAARSRDGVDDDELQTMIDAIVAGTGAVTGAPGPTAEPVPTGADLARLSARLLWRVAGEHRPGRPTAPSPSLRAAAGRFLVTVAVHVTGVTPPVVRALVAAYRALELDTGLVHTRLLRAADAPGPGPGATGVPAAARQADSPAAARQADSPVVVRQADSPVVVRQADGSEPGYALPWTTGADTAPDGATTDKRSATTDERGTTTDERPEPGVIRLDELVLARRQTETEDVAALLSTIFTAAGDDDADRPVEGPAPTARLVNGLDLAHGALLRELATRGSWTRAEFVAVADRHGVLPDGAVDLLNEVAIEATGEPVVEGDDDLSVNDHAVEELLR
jgi:hypothetical protein